MTLWIILLYGSFALVDILDKFLLSKRKIRPLSYTFFTVVTGVLLLVAWPFVYESLPSKSILLNLLSGAYFALAMYVFFKVLAFGEVSRVVPFIFGLVPVFDVVLSWIFKIHPLMVKEIAALFLLIPGALLIAYHPKRQLYRHLAWKLLAAFLFSSYNLLWAYGAQVGGSLNNLMWNRLGAAGVLILLLAAPLFRKKVFAFAEVPKKTHTSGLFVAKQALGGFNFVALSYFLAVGTVVVVDALSGFRYVFLFLGALFLSKKYRQVLDEEIDKKIIKIKFAALVVIFLGTLILFL